MHSELILPEKVGNPHSFIDVRIIIYQMIMVFVKFVKVYVPTCYIVRCRSKKFKTNFDQDIEDSNYAFLKNCTSIFETFYLLLKCNYIKKDHTHGIIDYIINLILN